jgi:uncharacterized integral membrane protein
LKTLRWLLLALVAVVLIFFAINNRQIVSLSLRPFPLELTTGLYLVVLLALFAGFLLGTLVAWMNGHRARREARHNARRIDELERALAAQSPPKEAAREPSVSSR